MATITLKNIPARLHRELKARAKARHRSLNKEIIATLNETAGQTPRNGVEEQLEEARRIRRLFKGRTTAAEIQAFKIAGRRR